MRERLTFMTITVKVTLEQIDCIISSMEASYLKMVKKAQRSTEPRNLKTVKELADWQMLTQELMMTRASYLNEHEHQEVSDNPGSSPLHGEADAPAVST